MANEKLASLGYAVTDEVAAVYNTVSGLSMYVHVSLFSVRFNRRYVLGRAVTPLKHHAPVPYVTLQCKECMEWEKWDNLHERCGNTQHLPQADSWLPLVRDKNSHDTSHRDMIRFSTENFGQVKPYLE